MRCIFFIDESGPFEEDKSSLVGGYLCFDKNLRQWDQDVQARLKTLSQKFGIGENDLRHRTDLKQWHTDRVGDISKQLTDFPGLQFFSLKDDSPSSPHDSVYWYISMLADAVAQTLYAIRPSLEEPLQAIEVIAAERWDKNAEAVITKPLYQQALESSIEKALMRIGLPPLQLDVLIRNGIGYAPLVLADCYCNAANSNKKIDKEFIAYLDGRKKIVYNALKGEDYNGFYGAQRDYFNLIASYIANRKLEGLSPDYQQAAQKTCAALTEDLSLRSQSKDPRYFTAALFSYLEMVEYESNRLRNYASIIKVYLHLIELIQTLNHPNKDALIFAVRTELLAVANHSGNTALSKECISLNLPLVPQALACHASMPSVWVFYNISAMTRQHTYDYTEGVSLLEDAAKKRILYSEWQAMLHQDLGGSLPPPDEELGKIYSSLGQAYGMGCIVHPTAENKQKALGNIQKTLDIFIQNPAESLRTRTYLLHLARITNDENLFTQTLAQIAPDAKDILNQAKAILSIPGQPFLYFHLLAGAVRFPQLKELRASLRTEGAILIPQKINFFLSCTFIREWAYLLFLENGTDRGLRSFTDAYHWLDRGDNIHSAPLRLVKASLLAAEFNIAHKKEQELQKALTELCALSPEYHTVFSPYLNKLSAPELKEKFYF